ncbi:MAG: OmpA family protein [Saprospiraceae bacterium]|nr:OmpA family protein [Saprospiraceae bacterium]
MLHKPAILYIALQPVEQKIVALEKPKPTILQNLFFKSGSAELLPESNTEIELLFHLLTDNPLLNITITGHTDDIGKNEDNLILSEKRAQSVAQALITKGIGAKRLTAEGKGETQPIATNNTEEGRQKNRRTEFVISSQ